MIIPTIFTGSPFSPWIFAGGDLAGKIAAMRRVRQPVHTAYIGLVWCLRDHIAVNDSPDHRRTAAPGGKQPPPPRSGVLPRLSGDAATIASHVFATSAFMIVPLARVLYTVITKESASSSPQNGGCKASAASRRAGRAAAPTTQSSVLLRWP
jgi:hypothetical protein